MRRAARRVLDYGCGSGILAIAAAKLGAADVAGVDIDPQALESAARQCRRATSATSRSTCPTSSAKPHAPSRFDIVVANILTNPLKLLAPMLAGRVAPGGALVLSGVLARQADEVIAAYAPHIALARRAERDGWVALARPGATGRGAR